MSLEDIGSVEALLRRAPAAWTETANHRPLVVSQGVSVLVVLPRESLGVVFTSGDRALFRSLILVREHVRLEILNMSAACGNRAETFVRVL